MSPRSEINAIPQFVEPRKFAQKRVELSGAIPSAKLERLASEVDAINFVKVELAFDLDEQHRKVITGKIAASLARQCQRCLGQVESLTSMDIALVMVWDDDQAKQLSDAEPWIVQEESADLYAVVEEEILLNMPYLAYHDEMCVDPASLQSGDFDAVDDKAPNPFEMLKSLKGNLGKAPKK